MRGARGGREYKTAVPGHAGKQRLQRQTKTTRRCSDQEGIEVCRSDASKRKMDRVLTIMSKIPSMRP